MTKKELLALRDVKVHEHLKQYAPVWFVDETFNLPDRQMTFHAVFRHSLYGWVKRRYLYDGANDVLYHKGQVTITLEETLDLQEKYEPNINVTVPDTPNAYGG